MPPSQTSLLAPHQPRRQPLPLLSIEKRPPALATSAGSLARSLTHSLTHSFISSPFTHSFTHSLTPSPFSHLSSIPTTDTTTSITTSITTTTTTTPKPRPHKPQTHRASSTVQHDQDQDPASNVVSLHASPLYSQCRSVFRKDRYCIPYPPKFGLFFSNLGGMQ